MKYNASGVAHIDESMEGITLHRTRPVYGRAVVVHLSSAMSSARAGCGVVGEATAGAFPGVMASMVKYAGYGGSYNVQGTLSLLSVAGSGSVRIQGGLAWAEVQTELMSDVRGALRRSPQLTSQARSCRR